MTTTVKKTRAVEKSKRIGKKRLPESLCELNAESLKAIRAYLSKKGIPATPDNVREAWDDSVASHEAIEDCLAGRLERVTPEEFHKFLVEP